MENFIKRENKTKIYTLWNTENKKALQIVIGGQIN